MQAVHASWELSLGRSEGDTRAQLNLDLKKADEGPVAWTEWRRLRTIIAVLLGIPAFFLIGLAILGFGLDFSPAAGLFNGLFAHSNPTLNTIIGRVVLFGPVASFLLIAIPSLRLSIRRQRGEFAAGVSFVGTSLQLVAMVVGFLLCAFFVLHGIADNLPCWTGHTSSSCG